MLKEIRIKVLTYEGMYYTYGIINKNTDDVIDFKKLVAEIDEETGTVKDVTEEIGLAEKIEAVADWCLDKLKNTLENDKFIYCRPEQKILNVKEIKETIINRY